MKPNLSGLSLCIIIVYDSPVIHARWPPLLKIEISINGKNRLIVEPAEIYI